MEKIDILVATYNGEKYLEKQLNSLINQTHKNIKIIISDDTSKDNTKKIIEEYAKKDGRIEYYFQNKNLGYIKNFEFLLSKSTADYIMFCDQDDIWYENKAEKSLKVLKENKVDLVYVDAKQIDENDNVLRESYFKYKNMPFINGKNNILAFSRHIAIGCSEMFTKDVKEKMLPFKKHVIAHDWIPMYIASKNKGVKCIKEPLFGYRMHNANVFGGRGFKQNLTIWKNKNGNTYKSYMSWREQTLKRAYLGGAKMCYEYSKNRQNNIEENVIKYYEKVLNTKVINLSLHKYFKYLAFKGIGKRAFKEIVMLHFPLLGFIVFKIR